MDICRDRSHAIRLNEGQHEVFLPGLAFLLDLYSHLNFVEEMQGLGSIGRRHFRLLCSLGPALQLYRTLYPVFRYEHNNALLSDFHHPGTVLTWPVPKEDEGVELSRSSACHLSIAMPDVEHLALLRDERGLAELLARSLQANAGAQHSVHDNVRVPSDGGCEVGVNGHGEAVVIELGLGDLARAEVLRLGHAPRGHEPNESIQVRVLVLDSGSIQRVCQ
mmetsp:Transcript_2833/g.4725  ORF Transcript_2833/g.4725 Transcript_2833/m.4725 type:complete len:220 (+) Transcript_2833:58-717(+)